MSVRKYMLVIALLGLLSFAFAGYLTPQLESILDTLSVGRKTKVYVHLAAKPDLSRFAHRDYAGKIARLKEFAGEKQRPLAEFLQGCAGQVERIRRFWVFNGIACQATESVIRTAVMRSEVEFISGGPQAGIDPPIQQGFAPDYWNVPRVKATDCWNAGYTGEGTVLCIFDKGMLLDHVSYGDYPNNWKWRNFINNDPHWEYAWFDPEGNHTEPYDYDDPGGHGTHVGGIAVAGDGIAGSGLPDIGVAPGAKLIACTYRGLETEDYHHECFEWIAGLANTTYGNLAPGVVNCSWGDPWVWNSQEFWSDIQTLRQLDIIPVCAIGNNVFPYPPNIPPGNFPTTIGVGATNKLDQQAWFSCTGPAPDELPWNDPQHWSRPDWELMAVDLMAPGMTTGDDPNNTSGIISADRNNPNGYTSMAGTSQASPHVCGAIALMQDAAITTFGHKLSYYDLYDLLIESADPVGQSLPDIDYGWGRLDCKAACDSVEHYRMKSSFGLALTNTSQRKLAYEPFQQVLHLVYETADYIRYTFSADQGVSWTVEEKIADGITPSLALDASGNPHVVFKDGAYLCYSRRIDGQWTQPDTIYDDWFTWNVFEPSLALSADSAYVVFITIGTMPSKIMFGTFALDDPEPQMEVSIVNQYAMPFRYRLPAIALQSTENGIDVHVVYNRFYDSGTGFFGYEVAYGCRSEDWIETPVSDYTDDRPAENHSLIQAGDKTWIVWQDGGSPDIYYRIRAGGIWLDAPQPVAVTDGWSFTPRCTFNPVSPDNVYAAWSEWDAANTQWDAYFSSYTNGWQDPTNLTDGIPSDARDPDIVYMPSWLIEGTAFVTYAEGNQTWAERGTYLPLYQIKTWQSTLPLAGGSQSKGAKPSKNTGIIGINPAPARSVVMVRYRSATAKALDLKIYDAAGRLIRQQMVEVTRGMNEIKIPRDNQPAGTYFLRLDDGSASKLEKIVFVK